MLKRTKSISQILKEIGEQPTKNKIEKLREYSNNKMLLRILKYTYDPQVKFNVPDSPPPYNPTRIRNGEGLLYNEYRRLGIFVVGGGYDHMNQTKREQQFITTLEYVDADDAEVLCNMISKKRFKGISKKTVETAFPELFE